ncbi:glycosyltransferase family 4 protein [Spirillospora sp. NPDC049024]
MNREAAPDRRLKIAYVVNQYPPNVTTGLGRYVELITPHLARGHRLAVFTLNAGRQPVHERHGSVTVHRPPGRILGAVSRRRRLNRTRRLDFLLLTANVVVSNWRYFLRLRRAAERPDLVAVHDSTNFLCGLLCHHVLRLPVVFHVHTTEYGVAPRRTIADPLNAFAALERHLGRIARRVVVPTPEVRDQLAAAGWDPARIEVVRLGGTFEPLVAGLDRERLRRRAGDLRARLGIPADAPVLLFVGRLERQKGVHELLEAVPRMTEAVPGLRLVLLGEGDEAAARAAGDRVLTRGFVSGPALTEYYAMADACVFPSLFEPFGLVATESMALGRPTILGAGFSRIFAGDPARPAVRFVGGTGPADIADAVIDVMTDPEARRALGERGERFVREELSWTRAARETLALYEESV